MQTQKGNYLAAILKSPQTVFTYGELALMWSDPGSSATRVRVGYYVNKGDLIRLRRGLYAKTKDYDKLEVASRIFVPAYVSFETVLAREGVIFQTYKPIFVASYTSRTLEIDGQVYVFKTMNRRILTNAAGVEHNDGVSTASKERAILDTLYINQDYYFDNLRSVDWQAINHLLPIYENKQLEKKVAKLSQFL